MTFLKIVLRKTLPLETRIKILVLTHILVLEFYGYICYIIDISDLINILKYIEIIIYLINYFLSIKIL